jgi:diguanylate cyclase (GGDEF)-like protein/PAS domain S-box-containing protein
MFGDRDSGYPNSSALGEKMAQKIFKALLISNRNDIAKVVKEFLVEPESGGRNGHLFELQSASNTADAKTMLCKGCFDIGLLDLSSSNGDVAILIRQISDEAPYLPVVALADVADEEIAIQAVQAGAQEYLVLSQLDRPTLTRAMRYSVERKQSEKALLESEERFKSLFENVALGLYRATPDGRFLLANPAFVKMLGFSSFEELANANIGEAGFSLEYTRSVFTQIVEQQGEIVGLRSSWMKLDGTILYARESAKAIRDLNGKTLYYEGTVEDITLQVRAEEEMRLVAKVFDNMSEGVVIADAQANIISVNEAFSVITGYLPEEVIGKNPRLLKSGRHDDEFYRKMWAVLLETGQWRGEIWNRRKDGEIYPEWLTISQIKDEVGKVTNYVAIFIDITSRKQNEELLHYLATHDPLTNLPNRELYRDRLKRAMARSQRNKKKVGVLVLDLDGFKQVNDTLGHGNGDLLLQQIAERLVACVRESDTVARLGGDEFSLVLEEISCTQDIVTVVDKILLAIGEPYGLNGHEASVTTSIGICLFPDDFDTLEALMQHADQAMYRAKGDGKNKFHFYRRIARDSMEECEDSSRETVSQLPG